MKNMNTNTTTATIETENENFKVVETTVRTIIAKEQKEEEKKMKTLTLEDVVGLTFGTDFTIKTVDGNMVILSLKEIEDDMNEFVKNTHLWRRWVMGQMFYMLNYEGRWSGNEGYDGCLKDTKAFKYQFTMMKDELNRQYHVWKDGETERYEEMNIFFNKNNIADICAEYVEKLTKHLNGLKRKNCKGKAYITFHGRHCFVDDVKKTFIMPIAIAISEIKSSSNPRQLYLAYNMFMNVYQDLPRDTKKIKAWVDAYKASGAYFTMQNMLMFHNCFLIKRSIGNYYYSPSVQGVVRGEEGVKYLRNFAKEVMSMPFGTEGYKLLGILRQMIEDNNFDYEKAIGRK